MRRINLSGRRCGRLLVLHFVGAKNTHAMWQCKCDCGKLHIISAAHLTHRTNPTQSCGCLARETRHKNYQRGYTPEARAKGGRTRTRHGGAVRATDRSPMCRLYKRWQGMLERCSNPKHTHYQLYGGRGITVCDRWLDFAVFAADMGTPPTEGLTLDRINNDGNYEPGNVRWATVTEQQANRRTIEPERRSAIVRKAWVTRRGAVR